MVARIILSFKYDVNFRMSSALTSVSVEANFSMSLRVNDFICLTEGTPSLFNYIK